MSKRNKVVKKVLRGATIVERVNKSVRHPHRNIRIDKKRVDHTQDTYILRGKEIRNERLGGGRRNRTANEDEEKESTVKLNRIKYVQIG